MVKIMKIIIDPNNYNQLTMIKNKRDMNLYESVKKIENDYYNRKLSDDSSNANTDSMEPMLISRQRENDYENNVKVERYEKAREFTEKELNGCLIQRFIRSKGRNRNLDKNVSLREGGKVLNRVDTVNVNKINCKSTFNKEGQGTGGVSRGKSNTRHGSILNPKSNSNFDVLPLINPNANTNAPSDAPEDRKKRYTRPTIIRLEYKTRYNSSKKPNIAYYLINKEYIEPNIRINSKEVIEKYTSLCTISTHKKNTFEIVLMSGESLKPYEYYANEIITMFHKLYKFLLITIVIDFIKDERGIIYFLGVKSFTPLQTEKCTILNLNSEENIRKLYKTWTCKLCMLSYPKAKITKVVTFKLLMNLRHNLAKRGKGIFNHINNNAFNESLSCRVCDLCYKLLLTEQELMEIQQTIALCNNIPVQSEDELIKNNNAPENMSKVLLKLGKVEQWRILFYFVRFYMLDVKKIKFEENLNYKLYIKLFDQKFAISIFDGIEKFIEEDEVEINRSKIVYFFTTESENSNLKQLVKNEEVDFRIVVNDDWYNPIAQCSTTCLSFFDKDSSGKTTRVKNTLNFFSNSIKHFKCQVYIGLNNDGEILSESFPLYNYKSLNTVYLTDNDYFSHHPFPDDWYELFVPPDTSLTNTKDYNFEKIIDEIIHGLEFHSRGNKKKALPEQLYDPYETLVQIEGKKTLISKIKSIPVIVDKKYEKKNLIKSKSRPTTSNLEDHLIRIKIKNKVLDMDVENTGKTSSNNNSMSDSDNIELNSYTHNINTINHAFL